MSDGNGGVIGSAVIPTNTAASGVWRPSSIARQLQGAGLEWPSSAVDAQFSNVVFLAHCNESSVAYLKDYSSNGADAGIITRSAAAGGSKSTSSKFGPRCVASTSNTAGLGYHARLASAIGSGDFTIEGWICPTSSGLNMELLDLRPTSAVTNGPMVVIKTTNVLAYLKSASAYDITGTTTVSLNTFHHWHVTRSGTTAYMGMDGIQEGSDVSDSNNYTSVDLWIGTQLLDGAGMIVGRFDEIRISKFARYARTYTVPTAPFPDQ